ncbi:S8 family serine peptidase [Anaerobacillus sp. CMMVII]|uniref:cell wall-binding repeat-containing protein n=1 Tax=Anaerobacillus sp. CMMVII TaxID=2755588 RepID=UPI0021C4DC11|nr:cell wall-binding repeat-containing protein [Anaerobacillus sp. CMMVII]MCT8140230.1 S8 family serine peptidase [Anaerobacillus sp. CMMVII]
MENRNFKSILKKRGENELNKKVKPLVSLLLTFLLIFSNFGFAVSAQSLPERAPSKGNANATADKPIKLDFTQLDKTYNPSDIVRVLVEMKEEPGVFHAVQSGVKYDELSSAKQKELHNKAVQGQQSVQASLQQQGLNVDVLHSFTAVTNGFSAEVTYADLAKIENTAGVKAVYIVNEYERPDVEAPEMLYSKEMVKAQKTWDEFDYKGEGLVIGIIDTGIDPAHRDMVLSDGVEFKIDKELVQALDVPGKWFTDKIPYGYNYMDKSFEILDLGPGASHHGMHVGGTAGANGDEDNGGIKGVAPEAQLLALKVFGNDPLIPTTYGDVYVKSIDDALKLGVDVLNLSLGSTAGFVSPNDPEQQAVKRAQESGVVVAISAGNSAHFGNGWDNPFPSSSNPDIGVTGSPSVSYQSIGVASSENNYINMSALQFTSDSGETGLLPYMSSGKVDPVTLDGEYEIVYAGLGGPDDFNDIDVEGKIALILRGTYNFVDKTKNAQANGAVGAIIFNNASGYVNMADDPAITIPHLFMARTEGLHLQSLIADNVKIAFNGDETTAANPEAGNMSDFTSWGLTPNLDFKPEITAPGGNILSTLQGDSYGLMSGTSMAAPHVAGGAALILERVDKEFGYDGAARSLLAKNLLLNTAVPKLDTGLVNGALGLNNYFSPRRQGAGEMDLHAASSTPAYVVNPVDGEAKVALRQVTNNVKFDLDVTNFSDAEVTYDIQKKLQTDLAAFGEMGWEPNKLEAMTLVNAPFVAKIGGEVVDSVSIPANGKVTVSFELDLTEARVAWTQGEPSSLAKDVFPNGYFAEGFVTFVDPNDTNPPLSVPFVGFNGEWDKAPIIDAPIYDATSFYGFTGFLDNDYYFLGFKPGSGYTDNLAFSPELTNAIPILSFLRNAKEVQYSILDENGNKLRAITAQTNVRKNYFDRGLNNPYTIVPAAAWDGKVKNQQVEDGLYVYEVKAKIDFDGAKWQTFTYPIQVDTVAPTVDAKYDAKTNTLTWSAEDTGSGVSYFNVLVNGESILEEGQVIPSIEANEYEVAFDSIAVGSTITIEAVDFANNVGSGSILGAGDTNIPNMYVTHPDLLGIYDSLEIPISGYITNNSKMDVFKVNGQEVALNYNEETKRYEFSGTFTVEKDGVFDIPIYSRDVAGNEATLSRTIVVDTTPAEVSVAAPASTIASEATLAVTVKDNFDRVRVVVDGDEVLNQTFRAPYQQRSFNQTIEATVALEKGTNNFTVEVFDIAGNKTEKVVTVVRESVDRLSGKTRFATAVNVSKEGWETSNVVIISRSDDFTDALSGVPLAKKHDAPILLTNTKSLSKATADEIARLGATEVIILGGELAVSAAVEAELKALVPNVKRISGKTRWETSALIAHEVAPEGSSEAVVVYGRDYADALAIAPYAAAKGMPILLTDKEKLPKATADALAALNVETTYALGGHLVMSDEVFNALPGGERFAGKTRFDTALMVVEKFNQGAEHFYVATTNDFTDALAGAALAAKKDTGIFLVGNSVRANLKTYIAENGVETLTVLGGELAISAELFAELVNLFKN